MIFFGIFSSASAKKTERQPRARAVNFSWCPEAPLLPLERGMNKLSERKKRMTEKHARGHSPLVKTHRATRQVSSFFSEARCASDLWVKKLIRCTITYVAQHEAPPRSPRTRKRAHRKSDCESSVARQRTFCMWLPHCLRQFQL